MSNLPKLSSQCFNNKKETLPRLDTSLNKPSKYAELQKLDECINESYEKVEKLMFNEDLNEEYERIKKDYSNLIAVFQKSITNNNTQIHHEFNSLEEFQTAVDLGKFDLEQYSIKEINKLILDLEKLENKANDRKLEELDLKTIEDFHRAVDMGILNINKYSVSEINELLNTLSDNT